MPVLDFVYFDAGGGHRASATALAEAIQRGQLPWTIRMMNLQEVLDPIDLSRKLTGRRLQDVYNHVLRKGWTLGSPQMLRVLSAFIQSFHRLSVKHLARHWSQDAPDLVVSFVPHFNRALREGLERAAPRAPLVTILTDLADYPPHFWFEKQEQYFICGTAKAVEQGRRMGLADRWLLRSSGMIVHPRFYDSLPADRDAERRRLGLDGGLPTGLVMFGGLGSNAMLEIDRRLSAARAPVQLIHICGRNERLREKLQAHSAPHPRYIEGFTTEIPFYMSLSDFFIGKPGPGSISEALLMKLPVIVENNAWTLPQERYNAQWVAENEVGFVLKNFENIAETVNQLLEPQTCARLKARVARLNNRAVFEIPGLLAAILERSAESTERNMVAATGIEPVT